MKQQFYVSALSCGGEAIASVGTFDSLDVAKVTADLFASGVRAQNKSPFGPSDVELYIVQDEEGEIEHEVVVQRTDYDFPEVLLGA